MQTTRRTFLRVLGSALVGVAVAPSVAVAVESEISAWDVFGATDTGPLTMERLERAYRMCVAGSEAPTMAIISQATARQFGLVYDVEVA